MHVGGRGGGGELEEKWIRAMGEKEYVLFMEGLHEA